MDFDPIHYSPPSNNSLEKIIKRPQSLFPYPFHYRSTSSRFEGVAHSLAVFVKAAILTRPAIPNIGVLDPNFDTYHLVKAIPLPDSGMIHAGVLMRFKCLPNTHRLIGEPKDTPIKYEAYYLNFIFPDPIGQDVQTPLNWKAERYKPANAVLRHYAELDAIMNMDLRARRNVDRDLCGSRPVPPFLSLAEDQVRMHIDGRHPPHGSISLYGHTVQWLKYQQHLQNPMLRKCYYSLFRVNMDPEDETQDPDDPLPVISLVRIKSLRGISEQSLLNPPRGELDWRFLICEVARFQCRLFSNYNTVKVSEDGATRTLFTSHGRDFRLIGNIRYTRAEVTDAQGNLRVVTGIDGHLGGFERGKPWTRVGADVTRLLFAEKNCGGQEFLAGSIESEAVRKNIREYHQLSGPYQTVWQWFRARLMVLRDAAEREVEKMGWEDWQQMDYEAILRRYPLPELVWPEDGGQSDLEEYYGSDISSTISTQTDDEVLASDEEPYSREEGLLGWASGDEMIELPRVDDVPPGLEDPEEPRPIEVTHAVPDAPVMVDYSNSLRDGVSELVARQHERFLRKSLMLRLFKKLLEVVHLLEAFDNKHNHRDDLNSFGFLPQPAEHWGSGVLKGSVLVNPTTGKLYGVADWGTDSLMVPGWRIAFPPRFLWGPEIEGEARTLMRCIYMGAMRKEFQNRGVHEWEDFENDWRPESGWDKIRFNFKMDLDLLILGFEKQSRSGRSDNIVAEYLRDGSHLQMLIDTLLKDVFAFIALDINSRDITSNELLLGNEKLKEELKKGRFVGKRLKQHMFFKIED